MGHSIAFVDVGAQLRPDLDVLPDLAERAAMRLGTDATIAVRVGQSISAAGARFTRPSAPWLIGRVSMELVWPVLTVVLRCGRAEFVEYFDVSGILGVPAGRPLATCEVSR